jgi:hypothetical protein
MPEILEDLQKIIRCNGDTYSSYEVMGLLKQAAAEIERLRAEAAENRNAWRDQAEYADRDSYKGWRE